ncbi:MAG: ferredoxin:glutaredoxin reductase [Candidatus Bathyarchaeota archaeon]|nr:ferredoxin:glutaredoxin reductase [Candidatus Bathyarchaeota archaeon]
MISLERVKERAESDARTYGYYLNPDPAFLNSLLEGLRDNEERFGYPSCPCRLASGNLEIDRDIICPCDYRDPDVNEYGYCYCALYIRKDVFEEKSEIGQIPERRPVEKQNRTFKINTTEISKAGDTQKSSRITKKLWYCRQCGYVCFREDPPYVCPVCKAKREMFSEIRIEAHTQIQKA